MADVGRALGTTPRWTELRGVGRIGGLSLSEVFLYDRKGRLHEMYEVGNKITYGMNHEGAVWFNARCPSALLVLASLTKAYQLCTDGAPK